jgi:hypothetical protein
MRDIPFPTEVAKVLADLLDIRKELDNLPLSDPATFSEERRALCERLKRRTR